MASGIGAFAFFLGIHFIGFRFLKAEQLFKGIVATFILGFAFSIILDWFIFGRYGLPDGMVYALLSTAIYSMASFVYVLCIFGPYETSIRMRLVRELALKPDGLSLAELSSRYNTAIILDTRLKRLLGAGDIVRTGESLVLIKKTNAFLAIDAVAKKLHAFIHTL